MRVALVSETWTPEINGVAHTLGHLAQYLVGRGVTLQLIRPKPPSGGREGRAERDMQVRAFSLPGYAGVHVGAPDWRRLSRLWRQSRPDVIYIATEGPLGWAALATARHLSIPVVGGFHTNFDQYAANYHLRALSGIVTAGLRYFHNRCHMTLVPTRLQADRLLQRGFRHVDILGRGIDAERFAPTRRDAQLRARWGADDHRPVALYAGRLAAEKNTRLLVRALREMQFVQPNVIPVLVGDGPERSRLERQLPDAIFTGFLTGEALAQHYASADMFLFPSHSETYGNVVPEAMASGLPVVAFDQAAASELIADNHEGRLIDANDDDAFVQAAVDFCLQPASRARMGRAAREKVVHQRWDLIGERFFTYLTLTAQETQHALTTPHHV
ncbi:glycosyltransferase involved in cell wall biosynthesis [Chromohalobacter marismortui]|uniref:Glycosyltransferase involved in cell wall biosynthesis n=1 Tax=Chromohalobacter marismortui TaxID=42055 RepID=A0A4R7NVP9_9GAMM|nr:MULTISPECIES: glycosyltransferase family 1 protein [Chromohalobacter]MCI0511238.1 glycosyltransferase family 1 protein [Chromohalobacter sp.]MCI0592274.1 glycosyltransferase family 1 protein [Chromohalobacter sp.]TDU25263.1 glycosyltransferase involved in cell wall biosynthesis [Chromohalobacter marismortui]